VYKFICKSVFRDISFDRARNTGIGSSWLVLKIFVLILLTASCSRQVPQNGLLIAVSIPPQEWFVSRIAGEKANVMVLAGPGQNPHNYEPGPKQIQSLVSARAWILSGTEFEISLKPKIAALFPNLLIVDGTEGVRFRMLADHEHDDCDSDEHDHDGNHSLAAVDIHEHSSLELDRHTWLGRDPAKILAAHIRDTLSLLDEINAGYYSEQCESLVREIDNEFDRLKIVLAPLAGRDVYVYHPSFGYFLDEFGIQQEAVETGGKEPGPRELSRLIEKLKKEEAAVLFVQTQFPSNAAKTVADITGMDLIPFDPLAQDWLLNIRHMGKALEKLALEISGLNNQGNSKQCFIINAVSPDGTKP